LRQQQVAGADGVARLSNKQLMELGESWSTATPLHTLAQRAVGYYRA